MPHNAWLSPCVSLNVIEITYAWELDATVTAFGGGSGLLDVKVSKFSARGLDNADLVRSGVVSGEGISQMLYPVMSSLLLTGCDVCTSICWNPSWRVFTSLTGSCRGCRVAEV